MTSLLPHCVTSPSRVSNRMRNDDLKILNVNYCVHESRKVPNVDMLSPPPPSRFHPSLPFPPHPPPLPSLRVELVVSLMAQSL